MRRKKSPKITILLICALLVFSSALFAGNRLLNNFLEQNDSFLENISLNKHEEAQKSLDEIESSFFYQRVLSHYDLGPANILAFQKGVLSFHLREFEKAEKHFEEASRSEALSQKALFNQGMALLFKKDADQASFKKAVTRLENVILTEADPVSIESQVLSSRSQRVLFLLKMIQAGQKSQLKGSSKRGDLKEGDAMKEYQKTREKYKDGK